MGSSFFQNPDDDDQLEPRNGIFWDALIDQIRRDGFPERPRRILDVGCHRGGLLARLVERWAPDEVIGIDPLDSARTYARLRLAAAVPSLVLLDTSEWHRVPDRAVDLIVCHEVLFLMPDLDTLVKQIARILTTHGRAYVVAGCHAENPVWKSWRPQLEAMGHATFDHQPMDFLTAAAHQGLLPSVRPLRDGGWATYDPTEEGFKFPSVTALLDHQFKHKLLFRLVRK